MSGGSRRRAWQPGRAHRAARVRGVSLRCAVCVAGSSCQSQKRSPCQGQERQLRAAAAPAAAVDKQTPAAVLGRAGLRGERTAPQPGAAPCSRRCVSPRGPGRSHGRPFYTRPGCAVSLLPTSLPFCVALGRCEPEFCRFPDVRTKGIGVDEVTLVLFPTSMILWLCARLVPCGTLSPVTSVRSRSGSHSKRVPVAPSSQHGAQRELCRLQSCG